MLDYRAGVSARVRDVIGQITEYRVVREDMDCDEDLQISAGLECDRLCANIADEFGIEIDDDEWETAVNGTVGDVVDLIVRLTQA